MPSIRRRKVYRDNEAGISKSSFKRIALRTGTVKSQSVYVPEELRVKAKTFLTTIIRETLIYTESRRAMTVNQEDVRNTLERHTNLVKKILGSAPTKRCSTYASRKRNSKRSSGPKRKTSRNITFIRKVKFYQKQTDCVHLAKLPVERLIREIGQNYRNDLRWSPNAVNLLRYALELYLETLLKAAGYISIHARGKGRIDYKDIQIAEMIRDL